MSDTRHSGLVAGNITQFSDDGPPRRRRPRVELGTDDAYCAFCYTTLTPGCMYVRRGTVFCSAWCADKYADKYDDYRDNDKRPCEACGCLTVRTQRTADEVLLCQTCWDNVSFSA